MVFSVSRDVARSRSQHFKRKEIVAKDERDVTNHKVIVTGSNHGIGMQTALELAKRGADVIMACRDTKKAEAAKEVILKQVPNANLVIFKLDLGDMESIRAFSATIHEKYPHIDMLINNAGIYDFEATKKAQLKKTKDGFELHIGVNHLGTFLLTLLLLDVLNKAKNSRIVTVASFMHQLAEIKVEDLNLENSKFSSKYVPYSNSKMANILFTRELARRLGENSNIKVYSMCPGLVYVENIKEQNLFTRAAVNVAKHYSLFDLKDGCLSTLYCALNKSIENESGKMYRFLDVWDVESRIDDKQAADLWVKSEELVGQKFELLS